MSNSFLVNIDDYEFIKPLSSGSYCFSSIVKNVKTGETVETKTSLQEDNPDFPNENNYFINEVNILSKIKHSAFVKLLGYSKVDFKHTPHPVIFTEYCPNGTLLSALQHHSLNNTQKLKIIYGIANGMAYLHSHDILHRNLNPEVILLDENFNPKISDFLLAAKCNPDEIVLTGTPLYMAPEVFDEQGYTKKSEVYAFSLIVYEIITSQKPFKDIKSFYQLATSILNNQRPSFEGIEIPDSYKNLITKCWSQSQDQRPSFSQIVQLLKTDHGFITSDVNEEEFSEYVKFMDDSESSFESSKDVIPIGEESINQPITKELKQMFQDDPRKIKYFMVLEAKQEISRLSPHFRYNRNASITIDIDELKRIITDKYMDLTEELQSDQDADKDIADITATIDYEYKRLIDKINTQTICSSSLSVLNQTIQILKDSSEQETPDLANIQEQVNKVLDDHQEEMLFDKEKLRQISSSTTPISEMISTLEAIKQNPKYKNPLINELPKMSVLYSHSNKTPFYARSLANILSGNCFFISLYGNQSSTHRVLSSLSFNEIKYNENDDDITIYGPLDLVSFGKTVPFSLEMLKRFNGNFPNLYFIEVASGYEDESMKEWCEFISYISHYMIFCSETNPTQNDNDAFKNLLLQYFCGTLINCSPSSETPISIGDPDHEIKPKIDVDIDSDIEFLSQYLFAEIFRSRFNFIPSKTASTLSQAVIWDKDKTVIQKDKKDDFIKDIKQNYSYQAHNKAIEYFHDSIQKAVDDFVSKIEPGKYLKDLHLNKLLDVQLDKTQECLYTNIYPEFWNDPEIEVVSKILNSEVKNDFESSVMQIRLIESIGKLIYLLKSNTYKSSTLEAKSILKRINLFDPSFDTLTIPKAPSDVQKLVTKCENAYKNVITTLIANKEQKKVIRSFTNRLYEFIDHNPISSDKEYSECYHKMYSEIDSSKHKNIDKYIDVTLNIRKVLDEYRPKKFIVDIDQDSFKHGRIKLKANSNEFVLTQAMTCHEFYELIKKSFELQNIPFYVTRISTNEFNKPVEIEVIDDSANLSLLNSYNFTVYYGINIRSTGVLIESLIVQKTIKIADDFIIRTNSKDADFKVEFPADHKGWFNVEFNIVDESKAKDDSDIALIYLTMTAEEISFLQEGNLLFHQSRQNNQWIDEVDPIFLSFPDSNTAVFPLRHCSLHKIFPKTFSYRENAEKEKDFSKLLNSKYSRDWEYEDGDKKYKRGGVPYYLPVGFKSEGIQVDNFNEKTCVGFHATLATSVFSIIQNGFKLPSELPGKGVREEHIRLGLTVFGIKNFANAIFVTPSIKYASFYGMSENKIVAQSNIASYVHVGHIEHNQILLIILQTRVNPKSYKEIPNTTHYVLNDPHYDEDHVEWRIPNKADIFPYRILYKVQSLDDYLNLFTYKRRT